jgi:hypothetical protein
MIMGNSIHAGLSEAWSLAERAKALDSESANTIDIIIMFIRISSVNIPWPGKGMADADYIYAFQKIVMPIAMEFAPELVISKSCVYRSHQF